MIFVSDQLFHLQILDAAIQYGDRIALTDIRTGVNLKFSQLRNKSYNFAGALKLLGAKKAILWWYAWKTVISMLLSSWVVRYLDVLYRVFIQNLPNLIILDKHLIQFGKDFDSMIKKKEQNLINSIDGEDIMLDDILLTPFSSGTTGSPKCVQLTHRNFNTSTAVLKNALFDKLSEGRQRVTIGALPFYHGSGFWALCYCLLEGHQTIIMQFFHPVIMLNYIENYKIDTLNVVPAILENLCQDEIVTKCWDLSSLTTVLCGSAPLGKELSKRFLKKFPHVINLIQGYGMTELVALSHITPLDTPIDDDSYLGSCGKLLPGFEAMLLDEETGAIQNEPWKPGELLLRSETIMKGYLNDIEETRKEDILKYHENVNDAAVVGISDKDHGQIPKAFVVLANNEATDFQVKDLIKYVNDRVAPYKQLRGGIQTVNRLPKTPSGKISRKDLLNIEF
ncbi:4-coumarate--CoA ligase 2 [Dirofilaria immitis]|nr:4-coumarate--CoA ligase 2 [Dirofilaria immitis]